MITVTLGLAAICFLNQCHPALVGEQTPTGHYRLQQRSVISEGYGGDVLVFWERGQDLFAVHRVWKLRPSQHRVERLYSADPAQRVITDGCINVMPDVYDQLVECCSDGEMEIVK